MAPVTAGRGRRWTPGGAVRALRAAVRAGDWSDALWRAILLHQGEEYTTSGRGSASGVPFTYYVKTGRNGEPTEEIIVSRKENSKSITRSTLELGFANALAEQAQAGFVRGPKRLKCFGASYLYPIFVSWGLISGRTKGQGAAGGKVQEKREISSGKDSL